MNKILEKIEDVWDTIAFPFIILQHKISDYRFEKRMAKQRKKRKFSDSDCWGMCYWFGDTFPKMIRHLRNMKNGAPQLEFEEFDNFPLQWVAEESKCIMELKRKKWESMDKEYRKEYPFEEELDLWGKEKFFDRWLFVLSRIAYCLEQASDEITEIENEYEEEYHKQVFGDDSDKKSFKEWWNAHHEIVEYDEKGKPKLWRLITNEPDEELEKKYKKRNEEIEKYRNEMKDEAFDLLKKYFYHLWD